MNRTTEDITPQGIWNRFCIAHGVAQQSVDLFDCNADGFVKTREIGVKTKRQVLMRSKAMESLLIRETNTLVDDWTRKIHQYDGLIYIMFRKSKSGTVLPLYIGKTETFGKKGGNLSENIANLQADTGKFAKWGDGYMYHIGDLSRATLNPESEANSVQYHRWATELFNVVPSDSPKLKTPVYFWAKAWRPTDRGVWAEMTPTRLAFLEYLLIGVASSAFPNLLLNNEGAHRASLNRA